MLTAINSHIAQGTTGIYVANLSKAIPQHYESASIYNRVKRTLWLAQRVISRYAIWGRR